MIMFIRFRADNGPVGQMGQHIRVGHVGHWSVPVIRWPILHSSGIPRDFLVQWKPATAVELTL